MKGVKKMNNEFCQTSNVYRTYCNYTNRCCNNGFTCTTQQNTCCPRSQTQCCCNPTIRVGTTVTGDPNTNAIVTNSGGLGKLFTRDIIGIFRHIFGTSSQKEPVFLIHIYIGW